MEVFVVIREGVYRHEIVGIFSDFIKAKDIAKETIENEEDDYHKFLVGKCEIDKVIEDIEILGSFSRDDYENHPEHLIEWHDGE